MKYNVFISYSRKDAVIADKICEIFDKQEPQLTYFIDRQGIEASAEFPEVLAQAIDESSIVLFLASANSYQSDYTKKEVTYTINKKGGTAIFPLMLDNAPLPASLEFQLSNINWRTLSKNYTLEEHLVADIRKKLENPHIGETFAQRKQKKDNKIIVGAMAIVCALIGAAVMLFYNDKATKNTAITDSEKVSTLVCSADSLIAQADELKKTQQEDVRLPEELHLLDAASSKIDEAQAIKDAYSGTEHLPLFTTNLEGKRQAIETRKDSMFSSWSERAIDAYQFSQRVGSTSERQIAHRYATFALMVRPDNEDMQTLINKTNN